MSNTLIVSVVEAETIGDGFVEFQIHAADNYHEVTVNSFDTLVGVYQNYPDVEALLEAVSAHEKFDDLSWEIDENGNPVVAEGSPYSGILIRGFYPNAPLTCEAGHPLMYLANNRVSVSLLFASATDREINTEEVERDEHVVCNNPDCQAHIQPQSRQRVLEEGRSYHRTDPNHR